MTARVTVLMPVYNGERYLADAIESVLRQTFADFEFLIVDDGSTDGSVAIIGRYDDSRMRLVRNEGNLGLSASLNRGLQLAQGEYVARMDADDISRPERLAMQVAFMDAHPGVGVCGSWVRFFPRDKDALWRLPAHSEEILCWQFHTVGVAHPSVMMRRQLFLTHGLAYDAGCRYAQDFELWGRAIRFMEFANIQKVLLDYRISPEQTGARHAAGQMETVAPLRLERLRELGIEPDQDEQRLHEMIMNLELPAEPACLELAGHWLMRLDAANRAICMYPLDTFSHRLLDIWFSVCLSLAGTPASSLWKCLRLPLWNTVQDSTWRRARAVAAWTLQRGLWKSFRA